MQHFDHNLEPMIPYKQSITHRKINRIQQALVAAFLDFHEALDSVELDN